MDGRHPPGGSRLEASSPEQTQGAGTRLVETEAGAAEGRRRAAPGGSAPGKLLAAGAAQPGKAPNAGPAKSVLLWRTRKPDSERLWPGKSMQRRARSLESSLQPEQCRRGKHTHPPRAGANPAWPEHRERSPHRPGHLSAAAPSPQHD